MKMESLLLEAASSVDYDKYENLLDNIREMRYEEALEEMRLILSRDGEDREVLNWCLEGYIRSLLGEFQAAERAFDRACSLEPGNTFPLLIKAEFFFFIESYERALREAEKVIQFSERKEDLLLAYQIIAKSAIFKVLPILQEMTHLTELLALDDVDDFDGSDDYSLLSMKFDDDDRYKDFGDGIQGELFPSNSKRDRRSILDVVDKIREQEVEIPEEFFSLIDTGEEFIDRALSLSKEDFESWHIKSLYQQLRGELSEAILSLERAVELNPEEAFLWLELGSLYVETRRYEEAKRAFLKFYDLDEESSPEPLSDPDELLYVIQAIGEDYLYSELEQFDPEGVLTFKIEETIDRKELEDTPPTIPPISPVVPGKIDTKIGKNGRTEYLLTIYQRNIERNLEVDMDEEDIYDLFLDIIESIWNNFIQNIDLEPRFDV